MMKRQLPRPCCVRGHTFLADRLPPSPTVLDLGAGFGSFSVGMIRQFGARCCAVEANRQVCLRIPVSEQLRVLNCAVSDVDGPYRAEQIYLQQHRHRRSL